MDWLRENAVLLTIVINVGMLGVWVFYLAMFYREYVQQRRPNILVHLTNPLLKEAECLVVNLGEAPVHIEAVLAALHVKDIQKVALLTERQDFEERSPSLLHESIIKQGPLAPASFISAGSFAQIRERLLAVSSEQSSESDEKAVIEIRVLAIAKGNRLAAARRRFVIDGMPAETSITPENMSTEQLYSRSEQREIQRWMEKAFEVTVLDGRSQGWPPKSENGGDGS